MIKPEIQEEMDKAIDEILKSQRFRNEKIASLISNTDYIEWLIGFTKVEEFSDNDWDYSDEKLDDSLKEKIDNLRLFFEGIYQYAKKNYIYSLARPLSEYFQIKIGNIGLEIGYVSGQGTKFYCRRAQIEEMENPIDFMDIVNNKKQENVDYIDKSLETISNMFTEFYINGVPIEAMTEALNKTIKDIEQKECENNKQNILRKKF